MLLAALFTIAKRWQQPKRPNVHHGRWNHNEPVFRHKMKAAFTYHVSMNLKQTVPSERATRKIPQVGPFHLHAVSRTSKPTDTGKEQWPGSREEEPEGQLVGVEVLF